MLQKIVTNLYSRTAEDVRRGQELRFKNLSNVLSRLQTQLDENLVKSQQLERTVKSK